MSSPSPLAENAGLAFRGETPWLAAVLTDRQAQRLLHAANACGRPNIDVISGRLGVRDGEPHESCQIDFPAHFTEQEAALYEQPFAHLARQHSGWRNPRAQPDLRRALARLSRYLAMPAGAQAPDWRWIGEEMIPDDSLVVVARDDDFTHGVLQSGAFAAWYRVQEGATDAVRAIESFPFPWAPGRLLSALTASEEESRHALARAVRAGNVAALNEAITRAYGWPADLSDDEVRTKLLALHRARVSLVR